ncbi:MAG: hypothetical protein ACTHK8_00050 [Ginsengibacter sp.]
MVFNIIQLSLFPLTVLNRQTDVNLIRSDALLSYPDAFTGQSKRLPRPSVLLT